MIKKNPKNIYVTQPSLPSLDKFVPFLEKIWESKIITNNGQFHKQLENELANYLGVKYISLFSNGTLAIMTALQTLRITGEVITTPYTYVATTNSLIWNGLKPIFIDVDPLTGNMDSSKIEAAITKDTKAIMPVHVYGNCCDVEKINEISKKYSLKTIYDAAHAFGVKHNGESVLNFGDLSILSFHATKVYNTIEGGAIVSHDLETKKRIDNLKNFGFTDETNIIASGINAKMNEVQAAYGILQLKNIDNNIKKRRAIAQNYNKELKGIKGIKIIDPKNKKEHTYPYYPILVDENLYRKTRDELYNFLKSNNIYGRRYFYPLVSTFSMYKTLNSSNIKNLPNAHKLSEQIICLPIYPDLDLKTVSYISSLIRSES